MAIAGKVAITPGYEWSVDVAYDKLVVVTYGNNVYLSTKPSTGIEPTNEEYWMLLIENVTAEDLENIINGTTPVGNAKNADTVDGYHADDFVKTTGGTIESNSNSLAPLIIKTRNAKMSRLLYHGSNGALGYIGFAEKNSPVFVDAEQISQKFLLHTGNKPTGTYTGNGSATERTISTGGIGQFIILWSANGMGIVSPLGGWLFDTNGNVSFLSSVRLYYSSGTLKVATDNAIVNSNGTSVTYQVL